MSEMAAKRRRNCASSDLKSWPEHHNRSAFCAWSRFSASSQITDCGPSITASVTSSPRCAGRQWRKSRRAWRAPSAPRRPESRRSPRARVGMAWPIEIQVSVTTMSAPSTASRGSRSKKMSSRVARHRRPSRRPGSKPFGQAATASRSASGPPPRSSSAAHCCRRRATPSSCPRARRMLDHRLHVGHDLAGMGQVGQAVDHRHARIGAPAPPPWHGRRCGS